jgi:peptide-methionine (S)-S-oxide reductase
MMRRTLLAAALAATFLGSAWAQRAAAPPPQGMEAAIFAAGCFWCVEPPFDKLPGVVSTTSGYTDGSVANPTYQLVSGGQTGHTEAVRVVYDPAKVSYAKLLETFWRNVDPFDAGGQFCDRGSPYRPGVYTQGPEQAKLAEASKAAVAARFAKPVAVEIKPAATFYEAEDYHQDYYMKNPIRYRIYRLNCGRDARLEAVWSKD